MKRFLIALIPSISFASGFFGAAGGGTSIGGLITSGTDGSVLFVSPDGVMAQDNSNFFYSLTNHQLSFGVAPIITPFSTAGLIHNNAAGLLSSSLLVNADVSAGAAIVDTKLATISTANKVSNSATTATSSNTNSAIVARDGSGNFSATTITANLTGNASGTSASFTGNLTGDVTSIGMSTTVTDLPRTKIASGTNYRILANSSSGVMSENAALASGHSVYADTNGQLAGEVTVAKVRGGSGQDNSSITFPASGILGTVPSAGVVKTDGSTLSSEAQLAVARGGTNLASGTSGGVLGYTASGTLASSAALGASELVIGGGAGSTPTSLGSKGTTTTLLHGNAAGAPTFGAVSLTADVTGTLGLGNGGTGQTTANAALNALLPSQGSSSGLFLTTNGTNTSWASALSNPMNAAGQMIYGGSSGTPTLVAAGTSGQLLMSNGTSAPTFTDTVTGAKTFSGTFTGSGGLITGASGTANTTGDANLGTISSVTNTAYYEGSFNATFTNAWNQSHSIAVKYVRIGKVVTLQLPESIFAAGNPSASSINTAASVLPSALVPASTKKFPASIYNNAAATTIPGLFAIFTDGSMYFYRQADTTTSFTITANCGWYGDFSVTYTLN
jgi:hypothetical protein